jgi:hypothetical protein
MAHIRAGFHPTVYLHGVTLCNAFPAFKEGDWTIAARQAAHLSAFRQRQSQSQQYQVPQTASVRMPQLPPMLQAQDSRFGSRAPSSAPSSAYGSPQSTAGRRSGPRPQYREREGSTTSMSSIASHDTDILRSAMDSRYTDGGQKARLNAAIGPFLHSRRHA